MAEPVNPLFYEFGDFRVDAAKRLLLRGSEQISLTPKVFETLLIFLEHHGEVLEKEKLMNLLWADSFVEESNLAQNVAVLRKTLGEDSKQHKFILTIPGRGYRFVAEVRQMSHEAANAGSPVGESEPSSQQSEPNVRLIDQPKDSRKIRFLPYAAFGSFLFAIVLMAIWFLGYRDPAGGIPVVAKTSQLTSWSGLDFYPSISSDGNSIAFTSDRSGTFEIYVKQLIDGAREVQLTTDGQQNFEPAFSPNGGLIAYYSMDRGGIWVIPTTGGTAKQIADFGSHPAWSPDGSRLVFEMNSLTGFDFNAANAQPPSTIWTVSVDGGQPTQVTKAGNPVGGHGAPNWSPDGKRIVFDSSFFGTYSVWTVSLRGDDPHQISQPKDNATDACYSADGKSIFYMSDRGTSLLNVAVNRNGESVGDPKKVFDSSGSRSRQISISANGKRLVYSSLSTSSDIWIVPVSGGKSEKPVPEPLTHGKNTRHSLPTFSPDGKRIVFATYVIGSDFGLSIMDSDGSNVTQLVSDGASPSWFPDGKRIGFYKNKNDSYVSATIDGRKETKLIDLESLSPPRLSPDGKLVAFSMSAPEGENVWVISVEGGNPVQLTKSSEVANFPAWSPDGKWIAFQLKSGDDTHIAIMPSGGGRIEQITNEQGQSWLRDWSPDSTSVLFAGQRNDMWNIYSASRITKEIKQITTFDKLTAYVRYPAWSPVNDKIAFEYAETTGNIWMIELK